MLKKWNSIKICLDRESERERSRVDMTLQRGLPTVLSQCCVAFFARFFRFSPLLKQIQEQDTSKVMRVVLENTFD